MSTPLLLFAVSAAAAPAPRLTAATDSDGTFSVSVGSGHPWLASVPGALYTGGADRAMVFKNRTTASGADALGAWEADLFTGLAGGIRVEAAVRTYAAIDAITFDITLPDGANRTQRSQFNTSVLSNGGDAAPSLSYPAFSWSGSASRLPDMGLLTIAGQMTQDDAFGWLSQGFRPANIGRASGPSVVYEDPQEVALAICPLTHFHAAVQHSDAGGWRWGPSGELAALPAGFTHRTLLVLGPTGVTDAWDRMGAALRALHAEATEARRAVLEADLNVNVLSYYTDAGTAYMSGVAADNLAKVIAAADVPYGLVQLDDWAHATDSSHPVNCGCFLNWTAAPEWFGLGGWPGFAKATGLPLDLYLPGAGLCPGAGRELFNVSTLTGGGAPGAPNTFEVPTPADAARFFEKLMAQGLSQGMGSTYEIDFLFFQFNGVEAWRQSLDAFPQYFKALGSEATAAGVAVELCMAYPLHVLSAVMLPAVTSTRASIDYDWITNCDIGVSSFLAWAVGIRPSKDAFMSSNRSTVDIGPPFQQNGTSNMGSLPELNAIIAVFSTGPVGVGDGAGATNQTVVMATCTAAGGLLQPDKPLTAIDATFAKAGQDPRGAPNGHCKSAWDSGADGGAVWGSFSRLTGTKATTHYVLAINVSRPFLLQRRDLWPRPAAGATLLSRRWAHASSCANGSAAVASGCVAVSTAAGDLVDVRSRSSAARYALGESPFVLVCIHEVMENGWAVWEEGK